MESVVHDFRGALLWDRLICAVMMILIPGLCTVVLQKLKRIQLHHLFGRGVSRRARRLAAIVDPYLSVTIDEQEVTGDAYYEEVKAYLGESCSRTACHLRAEGASRNGDDAAAAAAGLVLSMLDGEEVADTFRGASVWWSARCIRPESHSCGAGQAERSFILHYHQRHRELVLDTYLHHVQQKGRNIMAKNRERKIFTNLLDQRGWSHVPFRHPKTFATLAMDPAKKKEITDDLDAFKNGKKDYARVGKAWKRGYLLYGPPGTGKSSMIAAMANHLDYDIYDIELTSVHSNTDLQMLLMTVKSKAIIVIEDIDCSFELTRASKKKKAAAEDGSGEKNGESSTADTSSKVTLSGLLNVVDGLCSAFDGERIIVFTTNHVEKLDPALIRRGRMDMHIEMSYCSFEAFKFLAKMYLDVDAHPLFDTVEELLREVEMTPADVAEELTRKRQDDDADTLADSCLAAMVKALEKAKEKANGGCTLGADLSAIVVVN